MPDKDRAILMNKRCGSAYDVGPGISRTSRKENDRETDIIKVSGANEHVVSRMDCLTDIKEVDTTTVELAHGTNLTTLKQQIVKVKLTD